MTVDPAVVRASLADATPDVFWTDRPERPAPRAALTGAGHPTDLVVVGGGFTGLWAAIQAKEDDPSRDVVVLERGRLGVAASGRNGGFVSSSLTHGLAQGLACWPDEIDTLERLADENRAGLEASLAAYDIDADYHVPGEITMALTEHQVASVREGYELHRDHGVAATLLDAMGARARVDSPRYLSGWVDPTVGLVDPGRLVWGLAAAAERLGVRLHEDTTVTAFDREDNGVVVRTEWGSVRADRVVLGTGAFRGPLKRLALYTLPVYDHVLMSEPLSAGPAGRRRLGRPRGPHRRGQPVPLLPPHPRRPGALRRLRRELPLPRQDRPPPGAVGARTTCWPATSSRSSPSSRGCASRIGGPASSTPPRGSPRCSARPSAGACRMPWATPGSGSPRPASVPASRSTSSTVATPR